MSLALSHFSNALWFDKLNEDLGVLSYFYFFVRIFCFFYFSQKLFNKEQSLKIHHWKVFQIWVGVIHYKNCKLKFFERLFVKFWIHHGGLSNLVDAIGALKSIHYLNCPLFRKIYMRVWLDFFRNDEMCPLIGVSGVRYL